MIRIRPKTLISGVLREIKIIKTDFYFKVFDLEYKTVMATYSTKTGRMWGATDWFVFPLHPDFNRIYYLRRHD